MHESHQVQKLLREVEALMRERGADRLKRVDILVGELLGFDDVSIRLHWEEMTEGTPMQGSEISVEFVPVKLKCPRCGLVFEKKGSELSCPTCRMIGTPTPSGKEFCVKNILV